MRSAVEVRFSRVSSRSATSARIRRTATVQGSEIKPSEPATAQRCGPVGIPFGVDLDPPVPHRVVDAPSTPVSVRSHVSGPRYDASFLVRIDGRVARSRRDHPGLTPDHVRSERSSWLSQAAYDVGSHPLSHARFCVLTADFFLRPEDFRPSINPGSELGSVTADGRPAAPVAAMS